MSRIVDAAGVPVTQGSGIEEVSDIEMKGGFDLATGLGSVQLRIPGTDKAFRMMPAQARVVGMRMIIEAERAMADATMMRVALDVLKMDPMEGVQFALTVAAQSRGDHAMAFEKEVARIKAAKQMEPEAPGETDGQPM